MYYTRKIPEPFQKKAGKPEISQETEISVLHAEEKTPVRKLRPSLSPFAAIFLLQCFSPQKKDG